MAGPAKATSTRVGNAKVKAHRAALNFEGWIDFVEVLERFELNTPRSTGKVYYDGLSEFLLAPILDKTKYLFHSMHERFIFC